MIQGASVAGSQQSSHSKLKDSQLTFCEGFGFRSNADNNDFGATTHEGSHDFHDQSAVENQNI